MNLRIIGLAALTAATLTLAACSGSANLAIAGAVTPQDAFAASDNSEDMKSVAGTDAKAYRASQDDSVGGDWTIYYYSPNKGKSYRCTERASDKKITATVEVLEPTIQYKTNYNVDTAKVKIFQPQAKDKAVVALSANVSLGGSTVTAGATLKASSFTKTEVISPQECKDQTGKDTTSPVYVLSGPTVNSKVYVNAENGDIVATSNTAIK